MPKKGRTAPVEEKKVITRAEIKQAEKARRKEEEKERKRKEKLAKKKSKMNNQEVAKTLQATIPYRNVYTNGVIETERGVYTKSYELVDVNYQAARLEDQQTMFLKYSELLNSFDPSVKVQISVNNRNIDEERFREDTLLAYQGNSLDPYITEYNEMLIDKMQKGNNNTQRDKYLTVAVEAESFDAACNIFSRLDADIMNMTKKIGGSEAIELSTVERLGILHDLLNVGHENEFVARKGDAEEWLKELVLKGWNTKDVIVPNGIKFYNKYIEIGDKYAQVLFIQDLPTYLPDVIISELTDCDCNMITSMNISIVPQDKAIKIVRNQMTNINSNIVARQQKASKSGYDPNLIGHELKKAQEDANELMESLTSKDQKMFQVNILLMPFADTYEELRKTVDSIVTIGRKYSCQIDTLVTQQELGFKSVLPLCYNQLMVSRTLTTASTAVFMPFTSQELNQKNGRYYGLNKISNNLILFNRESCKNGNGFILGTPGSGKSFTAKQEMGNVIFGTEDDIIVIDPENEYGPLIDILGGEVISIDAGGHNYINPLDMDSSYAGEKGKDPIVLKTDFVLSLCETVCGSYGGITPSQKSIIDRCVRAVYRDYLASEYVDEYGETNYDMSKVPTLLDFQRLLMAQSDREAREIGLALELYTAGSLDNFAHKTNVDVNNRFIAYNLRDVSDNMMTMAMLVILDSIWNRILRNHRLGKKTWVYVDEAHLLFSNRTSALFLRTLYKRSRKFNGFITCITQNVSDILDNPICKTMIGNSEFLILLNQAPDDRDKLAEQLGLSETQLSAITAANSGEGLLINAPNIIPFVNQYPKDTQLYKAMTTKPSEVLAFKKERKEEEERRTVAK